MPSIRGVVEGIFKVLVAVVVIIFIGALVTGMAAWGYDEIVDSRRAWQLVGKSGGVMMMDAAFGIVLAALGILYTSFSGNNEKQDRKESSGC
jgi:hypothetical protein